MAENIRPLSLSPVLKETSSVYSETADYLQNSHEDTVDRILKKRGMSMTPVLQDISRSPDKSFVNDSCIDEMLMTPKSPLGLKNKRSTFRKPPTTTRDTVRFSNALQSSTEENSISDISFFNTDARTDKRKLRQTSTFRNQKRKTEPVVQDLSLGEEKTDSSLTSFSIVEETKRRTNFRVKSKSAAPVRNVYDNVMDSTTSDTSVDLSVPRKSSALLRRSEKTQKRRNEAAFADALSATLSSENSSQESTASARVRRSENVKKFKKVVKDAVTENGSILNDFDDLSCSDSFASNVSVNKSQKSSSSRTLENEKDGTESEGTLADISGRRSSRSQNEEQNTSTLVETEENDAKEMATDQEVHSSEEMSANSSRRKSSRLQNKGDSSILVETAEKENGGRDIVSEHDLHSSGEETSANASRRKSERSQSEKKDSNACVDADPSGVEDQKSAGSENASAETSRSTNNSQRASLRKSSRSINRSVLPTNQDASIYSPTDSPLSFEQDTTAKSAKFEGEAPSVADADQPINKSRDKPVDSTVSNKSGEQATPFRKSSRQSEKIANRSVDLSKVSTPRAEQAEELEEPLVKESPKSCNQSIDADLNDTSASIKALRRSRSRASASRNDESAVSSSEMEQNSSAPKKRPSGLRVNDNNDSLWDKSASQLLSLSASDSLNSERDSDAGEELEGEQSNIDGEQSEKSMNLNTTNASEAAANQSYTLRSQRSNTSNVSKIGDQSMQIENGEKLVNISSQSASTQSKRSNKSSSHLASVSESVSPSRKEQHHSSVVGKRNESAANSSNRLEKSASENPNATYVTEKPSDVLHSSRSQRNSSAEQCENVSDSEKSSSSNTSRRRSRASHQEPLSSEGDASEAEEQHEIDTEKFNSPSSATRRPSENPANKNLSTSRLSANRSTKSGTSRSQSNICDVTNPAAPTANSSNRRISPDKSNNMQSDQSANANQDTSRLSVNRSANTRTSRSQSNICDVTNPAAPTANSSNRCISPDKSSNTQLGVSPRRSLSKSSPGKFLPQNTAESSQANNVDESSSSEMTGIVFKSDNINFQRYTFNSENELVPKNIVKQTTDTSFKSVGNASNLAVESNGGDNDDDDDDDDEDSIFNERPSIIHSESDDVNESLINGSLSTYDVSKICPRANSNGTFVKPNKANAVKSSLSRSLSSSSNEKRASLRRKSSANKSVSDSVFAARDYSTVAEFSIFASDQFETSASAFSDSGFSLRDSVRMTTNLSKVIRIVPKDDPTELDYEDASQLEDQSMKSAVEENMKLHITDDPPVGTFNSSSLNVDLNIASVHKSSLENSAGENQNNGTLTASQNSSPTKAASSNSSKTGRRSAEAREMVANERLDKSVTNADRSRRSANTSRQSEITHDESFEIVANETSSSSSRASRKRRSSEGREHQGSKLSTADKLELSRGTADEAAESVNESSRNVSLVEETRNEDYTENDALQGSMNGSACGETFASAATAQTETSVNRPTLKDGSDLSNDSEYFSSRNNSLNGTSNVANAAGGIPATNFNDYFAKPLYPVNRRVKSLQQSRSSNDSARSSGSLSLLSKCIKRKRGRRSNTRNNQPSALANKHNMNLRKREEAFPNTAAPKMSRPAYWVTNRLYSFLTEKLEPLHKILAKKKAELFVNFLQEKCKKLLKVDSEEAEEKVISAIKNEMIELRLVNSDFMFYNFVFEFLPFEIQDKVVPCAVPFSDQCSKANFNPDDLFAKFF